MFNMKPEVLNELQTDIALIEVSLTTTMIALKELSTNEKTKEMLNTGIAKMMERTIQHTLALASEDQGAEMMEKLNQMVESERERQAGEANAPGGGVEDAGEPQNTL